MGFRFGTRTNLGKGFGLNISKSGVTPSVRTKFGSISSKGFSVRTGIPGVSYRKSGGCMVVVALFTLSVILSKYLIH